MVMSSCGRLTDAAAAAAAAASSACLRSAGVGQRDILVLVTSKYPARTLLCKSDLLVLLEFLLTVLSLNRSIRPRLCEVQVHLPPKQVEALEVVDGVLRAVHIVVDDKGLALALEALLGDDVDDGAELVEEAVQRFDQGGDLDGLVEVADVYPFSAWLVF
jgi:hypothetical protein